MTRQQQEDKDELRSEYDLPHLLKGAVRGKYAERYRQGTICFSPHEAGNQDTSATPKKPDGK